MGKSKPIRFILGLALLATAAFISPSQASTNVDFNNSAFAAPSGLTSIPFGHAEFCKTRQSECGVNANIVDAEELTEERWRELLEVNARFNASIVAVTDEDLYKTVEFWTYPNGYGDCEDFVLAKRRALIALGWEPSTLLISVVLQTSGAGHAVLIVRTDRGDLVLDNLRGLVNVWNQTPYRYLKRQAQANAGLWVDLIDNRPMEVLVGLLG